LEGKKEVVFLLIARIIRHKGIYEFIKAAEILQQRGRLWFPDADSFLFESGKEGASASYIPSFVFQNN